MDCRKTKKQESLKSTGGIFSQECQNSQLLFDTQMQELKNALSLWIIWKRKQSYYRHRKFFSENEQCSLNDGGLSVILDSIRPAISYEHMIEHVFELQNQKRYQEAVDAYSEAGSYFSRSTLAGFGLRHAVLQISFCKMNNNFLIFLARPIYPSEELEVSWGNPSTAFPLVCTGFYKGWIESSGTTIRYTETRHWQEERLEISSLKSIHKTTSDWKYLEKSFKKVGNKAENMQYKA